MDNNRKILKELFNREVGHPKVTLKHCALLENVRKIRPVYELRHTRTEPEDEVRNYISGLRFNCKGDLVGSSFCYGDKIDLWGWTENKLDLSVQVGTGCPVSRFEWLPYDNERLILAVDKFGHMRLLDLVSEVSSFLLFVRSPGISYDLHHRIPHCVTIGEGGGAVSTLDFRCGFKTTIMEASKDPSNTFDIQWLGINPQKYVEFCIASNTDELRIYDRRYTSKPIHKLSTTMSSILNPYKDYDELPNPRNAVLDLSTNTKRSYNIKLSYNYNGTMLIACCALDSVLLFDTTMSYPIGRYDINSGPSRSPQPSTSSGIGSTENHSIKCFKCVEFFGPKSEYVVATAIMHDNPSNWLSSMYFWDTHTQRLVKSMPVTDRSCALAIHPHAPILATSLDDRGIRLWA